MKTTIIGLLLLATASVNAQEKAQTYQLADAPRYSCLLYTSDAADE